MSSESEPSFNELPALIKYLKENGNENEKLQDLTRLTRTLKGNPFLCEKLFLPFQQESCIKEGVISTHFVESHSKFQEHTKSFFFQALQLLETCEDAPFAEAIVDALVTAASHVGIGVHLTAEAVSLLTRSGRWPPCAALLLRGLCALASADAGAGVPHFPGAGGPPRIEPRRPDAPFFLLDGGAGGVFLGAAADWPFEHGYVFEAWLWVPEEDSDAAAAAEGSSYHIFRILGGGGGGSGAAADGDLALDVRLGRDGRLVVYSLHAPGRFRGRCPTEVPRGRWAHVRLRHVRSNVQSGLEVRVQGRPAGPPLKLPYPSRPKGAGGDAAGGARLYVGCGGWIPAPGAPVRARVYLLPPPAAAAWPLTQLSHGWITSLRLGSVDRRL